MQLLVPYLIWCHVGNYWSVGAGVVLGNIWLLSFHIDPLLCMFFDIVISHSSTCLIAFNPARRIPVISVIVIVVLFKNRLYMYQALISRRANRQLRSISPGVVTRVCRIRRICVPVHALTTGRHLTLVDAVLGPRPYHPSPRLHGNGQTPPSHHILCEVLDLGLWIITCHLLRIE